MTKSGKSESSRRRGVLAGLLAAVVLAGVTIAVWPQPHGRQIPQGATGYLRVTDDVGRAVAVPQPVRRIVSLAPNLTETLFAIGLGDRVVGVTDFCDYPPEAATRTHIGGPVTPNLEKIAALHPDLVFATRSGGNRLSTVQSLETLNIPVFTTDPHTVEQVIASEEQIGTLAGAADQSRAAAGELRGRLDRLSTQIAGASIVPVLLVVWPDPLITIGRNTFIADALRKAGAENVIQTEQDWPNTSFEVVARLQPRYLVFANDHSEEANRLIQELGSRSGWKDLNAVREGRIVVLSEAIARPAPRMVDEIEKLAARLHPERFPSAAKGNS